MGFLDVMPVRSHMGGHLIVNHAPLTAGQVFVQGEPIFMAAAGTVSGFPQDGTEAIIADFPAGDVGTKRNLGGIACWGPGQAATAELTRTRVMIDPATGAAFAAGAVIPYYPFDKGNVFKAQVLAAGGAAAGVGLATHRGEMFQLTYSAGTTPDLGWGVELTAGVAGTDVLCHVIEVLAADGRPSGTAGTHFLFEIMTTGF